VKRISYSDFVADAFLANKGRYIYSQEGFQRRRVSVCCHIHGWWVQDPCAHITGGHGCRKCAEKARGINRKYSFGSFVEMANKVHNNRYIYDRKSFESKTDDKITIVCPIHGGFTQRFRAHLRGSGCPSCFDAKRGKSLIISFEEFANRAMVVHNNKYIYEENSYVSGVKKTDIICPDHGVFKQAPNNHLNGQGCPDCARIQAKNRKKLPFEEYVQACDKVHNGKYSYDESGYYSRHRKEHIDITCPVHGVFSQNATSHRFGRGCQQCVLDSEAQRFYDVARRNNPHLTVTGTYTGKRNKVTVMCDKGHITNILAEALIKPGESRCTHPNCSGENGVGRSELVVRELLDCFDIEFIANDREFLGGKEIDLYIPSLRVGVEYNGAIFHSEKYAIDKLHAKDKWRRCGELGVHLLTICSASHNFKAALTTIANRIGVDYERHFARKCLVVDCSCNSSEVIKLLNDTHVQGVIKGCEVLGLVNASGQLVSVMCFSLVNSERGKEADDSRWELRRFAGYGRTIGGFSKLLKAFIRKHVECRELISYSDNMLFSGGSYEAVGFKLVHEVQPTYIYVKNGTTMMKKSAAQKSKLCKINGFKFDASETEVENCRRNGWYRVWDCGKKKWSLKIE